MSEFSVSALETMVKKVIVDAQSCEDADLSADVSLQSDLRVDSLDMLDIMFRLEKGIAMVAEQCGVILEKMPRLSMKEFAAQEFDGLLTKRQTKRLHRSGFTDLMNEMLHTHAEKDVQEASKERWDNTAPGTVGRLQVLVRRFVLSQKPEDAVVS